MALRISQIQTQKQILAPVMQQSIEVLLLPITELSLAIETELQENPLLEIDESKTIKEKSKIDDLIDNSIRRLKDQPSNPIHDSSFGSDDDETDEKPITRALPLEDSLLNQLHLEFNDPLEIEIGEYIISNLDENGYFTGDCQEIAAKLDLENTQPIEMVLRMIQNFEPMGIAARDLKECLLIQCRHRFNGHADTLAKIINNHLEDLGKKRYVEIARKLRVTPEKIKEFAQLISSLEPIPTRKYRPLHSNLYSRPDVILTISEGGGFKVQINNEYIPHLRISPIYQRMLNNPNLPPEEKEYIREKIKNAILFMKSITQRNQTIKDISNYIVEHQREYLEGSTQLKPLTLKEVATSINRNESTVSRAVNNKFIQTPHGLVPMKFFFSTGLKTDSTHVTHSAGRTSISNRTIKEELRNLVEDEDKTNPLSDQEIQNHFAGRGVQLARRTVSKYRQALNILPSHLRKN